MKAPRQGRLCIFVLLMLVLNSLPALAKWEAYEDFWNEVASYPHLDEVWAEHLKQFQVAALLKTAEDLTFDCDASASDEVPTSVHRLRPGDIDVVGALGDSLTAANGADAAGIVRVLRQDRGLSWSAGGQDDLASGVITLPNILRQYNHDLRGMSTRSGTEKSRFAGFNAAVPGATADNLPGQARDLVAKMKASSVDMSHDWKLVTLLIGGNDLCQYCGREEKYSAYQYSAHIREALDILHAELPRTFVNLVGMFDIGPVANLGKGILCKGVHVAICSCALQERNAEMLKTVADEYNKALEDLLATGRYETRDDFTVVFQPFLQYSDLPSMDDGSPDLSYFAPDCFHFSQKGHAGASTMLWNGMFDPVGQKSRNRSFEETLQCPPVGAFIPTAQNSGGD